MHGDSNPVFPTAPPLKYMSVDIQLVIRCLLKVESSFMYLYIHIHLYMYGSIYIYIDIRYIHVPLEYTDSIRYGGCFHVTA